MSDNKIPELHPVGDKILVEPIEVNLNSTSLILTTPKTDLVSGRIIAVGSGPNVKDMKEGDIVFYFKGTGIKFPYMNKDTEIVNYGTIHLIYSDPNEIS